MQNTSRRAVAAAILALLASALAACGGGGSGGNNNIAPTAPTVTLTANPTTVASGATATLTWSSTNANSCTASGGWSGTRATSGTETTTALSATSAFTLACSGAGGSGTASATVTVGGSTGNVTVTGTITFARIPYHPVLSQGFDYANTRQDPSRGITVEAIDAGTLTVIATTVTDASGRYSFDVPANAQVQVRARAELARRNPQSLPHWQFRVSDIDGNGPVYTFESSAFNSGSGAVRDVAIPSGWDSLGRPNGQRSAGPFAILDSIYVAVQLLLTVAPTIDLPVLGIDWSPSNNAGRTFYSGGTNPQIVLSGEINVDIDEYDPHTIIHEFGHYVEDTFSRSDSIGGPHGFGDILDPRVAFGEGFGYAFAAMALNDPVVRDAFGAGQQECSHFNIECCSGENPGWYSESSVQEVLWDFYDAPPGVGPDDPLELGFAPLWNVLIDAQRNTDAFTTIFSFVTNLKLQNPSSLNAINSIVFGEHMAPINMDVWGSTEFNIPFAAASADVLPVYTPIVVDGGPVVVRSISRFGTGNKLSNARFLRLSVVGTRNVRIAATSAIPGRDIDIQVFRRGSLIAEGVTPGEENFTVSLTDGEYAIAAFDCGFAECNDPQTGSNDLTVTITSN